MNRHTGKKPHKCNQCEMAFSDPASLKCHALKHLESRNYVCQICDKKFFTDKFLEIHMRIHKERDFKCEYCEKGFYRRTELQIHVRNHTGERPFACDKCPKKFAKKSYLNQHYWTHAKRKPYECSMCDKSFAFKSTFNNHINSIHGKDIKSEEVMELIEVNIENDADDSEGMKEVYLEVEDWEVYSGFEKEIKND